MYRAGGDRVHTANVLSGVEFRLCMDGLVICRDLEPVDKGTRPI